MASHVRAGSYVGTFKTKISSTPATNPITYVDSTTPSPYADGTHYQVIGYTGSDPNDPTKRIFSNVPDIVTNGSYQGGSSGDGINGTHSDCSGAIRTSWTWVPGPNQTMITDPPPVQVIVVQTCSVSASLGRPGGSASYNDGLGSSGSATFNPPISTGGTVSDTKYSVQAGGATVTLTTLNAMATASIVPSSASLSYTATLYPVTVNVVGTNNPYAGDFRALTGQQITASLGAPYGLPTGTKVTGYTWSFSNNNPIKYWDPNAPGDGQLTQIIPLGPTDYIGLPPIGSNTVSVSPISFYDEIASDTVIVKCAVTLILPDYSTPTINAASPQVTFIKPTVVWNVATGYVRKVTDPNTGYYGYGLEPPAGVSGNAGETWNNVTINVLAPFYGGSGCFAQIVTPNTTITNTTDPTKSVTTPGSNLTGLDNSFPYKGYTWTVPTLGANFDGPAAIFSYYNNPTDQGFTSVTTSDQYGTWVMYKPPAVGSQGTIWVPLQTYGWSWSFTSKWDGSLWNLWRASPTSDSYYQPTGVMNIPPQWSMIQNNSN